MRRLIQAKQALKQTNNIWKLIDRLKENKNNTRSTTTNKYTTETSNKPLFENPCWCRRMNNMYTNTTPMTVDRQKPSPPSAKTKKRNLWPTRAKTKKENLGAYRSCADHKRPTCLWLKAVGPESNCELHWEARVPKNLTDGHRSSDENKEDNEARTAIKSLPNRSSLACHSYIKKNTTKTQSKKHSLLVLQTREDNHSVTLKVRR